MSVRVIKGDLLQAKEEIIGHQVNCQSVMGSGVAKVLKEKYPVVYSSYMEYCKDKKPAQLLGKVQIVSTGDKVVANIFGQLNFGRSQIVYTNYDALKNALGILKSYAKERGLSVALPYNIGCGLANGDWDVVEPMIQEVFSDYEVTLYKI